MQVYGQLQNAALEILSADPTPAVQGRVWFNSTTLKLMADDGTNKRALLRNDQACVFGNSGTAANNIRLQRGGASVLQFVTGADTTAEGTLSTSLAQISAKFESYTSGTKPAVGNAGRIIWVTDLSSLYVDLGASWVPVATGAPITGSMMTNQTVTATQIANSTITGTQVASSINLPGKSVQENGNNVVVANTNATNSLAIIRGYCTSAGAITSGEGFTVTKLGTGNFNIAFSTSLADVPAVTAAVAPAGGGVGTLSCQITGSAVGGFNLLIYNNASALTDQAFSFIAIGQRT